MTAVAGDGARTEPEPSGDAAVTRLGSGGPWEALYGYCRVVRAGQSAITAGCTSTVDGRVAHVGDAAAQTAQAIRIGLDALAEVGAGPADVVRTRMYVTDRVYADEVGRAHNAVFGAVRPVATMVVVAGLIDPDHLVEVELEAWLGDR
ncbi:Rid family hydrolase [Micromonospora chaiyaphumensis]|uniref:Enamine deaminase RidA, house cleaning of reactive enamine intermediates, YjgF/YER057c/UK114 family n=1 Tax=Micromonospora chaiyaphumensis TaxID=307119 RepID=A0A1C4YP36_9ACTN|nr:Rid family hydrolase [Micromonospora chaiyaphumensis]SCF22456.1 Enamine deaminase RidA, house cleaning of reactive enamine intermediates, YjgF/YER057c/UK114 family [Micromonospora chaiyaphumensis]